MVDQYTKGPNTECAAYQDMAARWRLIRALMGGTDAMRAEGQLYLPQWPKETHERYNIRLKKSFLFGGFRRTIETLTGKVFTSGIALNDDVPPQLVEYSENIDREQNNLSTFAVKWFQDGLEVGLSHVLVDKPSIDVRNRQEALANGVRPYVVHVPAEHLIAWHYTMVGGRKVLSEIRIREIVVEPDGLWGEKVVEQVRRWQLLNGKAYWSLYRKAERGDVWVAVGGGATEMTRIPLVTFYADRTGFLTARPPLMDLAWKNCEHWQSASEQLHCLSIGRRPFPAFFGFGQEEVAGVNIGPFDGLVSKNQGARAELIESTGAALASGRQHLQDCKEEMAVMGAEMLVRKAVQKTATESSNEQTENDSKLGMIAGNFEDAVDNVLALMAEYDGLQESGSSTVNRDFGLSPLSQAELQFVLNARQQREISRELFYAIAKRYGIIPDDWDLEDERDLLANEGEF